MLTEFWLYPAALFWGWLTVMSGALAAAVGFYERVIKKRELRLRPYLLIIAAFIFIAGFLTWRDQLNTVRSLSLQLAEERKKNSPDLKGEIQLVATGTYSEESRVYASIIMLVAVRNLGAPSVAHTWRLVMEMPDHVMELIPRHSDEPMRLEREGKSSLVFPPKDWIIDKTETTPIPTEGRVAGMLGFVVPDYSDEQIRRALPRLTVKFQDVQGVPYTISHQLTNRDIEPG